MADHFSDCSLSPATLPHGFSLPLPLPLALQRSQSTPERSCSSALRANRESAPEPPRPALAALRPLPLPLPLSHLAVPLCPRVAQSQATHNARGSEEQLLTHARRAPNAIEAVLRLHALLRGEPSLSLKLRFELRRLRAVARRTSDERSGTCLWHVWALLRAARSLPALVDALNAMFCREIAPSHRDAASSGSRSRSRVDDSDAETCSAERRAALPGSSESMSQQTGESHTSASAHNLVMFLTPPPPASTPPRVPLAEISLPQPQLQQPVGGAQDENKENAPHPWAKLQEQHLVLRPPQGGLWDSPKKKGKGKAQDPEEKSRSSPVALHMKHLKFERQRRHRHGSQNRAAFDVVVLDELTRRDQ